MNFKTRIRRILFNLLFDPTYHNAGIDMFYPDYVHIGRGGGIAAPGLTVTGYIPDNVIVVG